MPNHAWEERTTAKGGGGDTRDDVPPEEGGSALDARDRSDLEGELVVPSPIGTSMLGVSGEKGVNSQIGAQSTTNPKSSVKIDEVVIEPKRSWKDVLVGNRDVKSGMKLEYIPSEDLEVVEYTYDEVRSEIKKWHFSLVGAVIDPFVPFTVMERYVSARWDMV